MFSKKLEEFKYLLFCLSLIFNVFETKIGIEDPLDHIDLCHFVVFD